MAEIKISDEDVRIYGAKLHDRQHDWNCACAPWSHRRFDEHAEYVLTALAQDDRLLPSEGEVSTQYGVRWHATPGYGDEWDDWGFHDEAQVRQEMASSPTPSTLLRRRTITLPVEPVVSDNSEGDSGG